MMTTSAVLSMAASRCSVQVYSIGCGRGASRDAGLRATLMPITAMRPFLIGIAGPSCSGKTDFAKALALSLPGAAVIVPLDSYYRRLDHLTYAERCQVNFDHPDALDWPLIVEHVSGWPGARGSRSRSICSISTPAPRG